VELRLDRAGQLVAALGHSGPAGRPPARSPQPGVIKATQWFLAPLVGRDPAVTQPSPASPSPVNWRPGVSQETTFDPNSPKVSQLPYIRVDTVGDDNAATLLGL